MPNTLATKLLDLLSDPRVGDISLSKQAEPPAWALQAFGELYHRSLKAHTIHVLGRDGVTYQSSEFDTAAELAPIVETLQEIVSQWPEQAAIPPGE